MTLIYIKEQRTVQFKSILDLLIFLVLPYFHLQHSTVEFSNLICYNSSPNGHYSCKVYIVSDMLLFHSNSLHRNM